MDNELIKLNAAKAVVDDSVLYGIFADIKFVQSLFHESLLL